MKAEHDQEPGEKSHEELRRIERLRSWLVSTIYCGRAGAEQSHYQDPPDGQVSLSGDSSDNMRVAFVVGHCCRWLTVSATASMRERQLIERYLRQTIVGLTGQ
jgi:hypothetical protein